MIERILKHWNFANIEILEQLHKGSPRLIYKIMADDKLYILKGIPEEKTESVIIGNVSAHKYLGNEKRIAPRIFAMSNGDFYVKENGFWFYLMEFINGTPMETTEENEYLLGKLAKQYHSYTDYDLLSEFNEDKQRFYEWFCDRNFKKEFDHIFNELPDFSKLDMCFIHTDLGPHNAMITAEGKAVLNMMYFNTIESENNLTVINLNTFKNKPTAACCCLYGNGNKKVYTKVSG